MAPASVITVPRGVTSSAKLHNLPIKLAGNQPVDALEGHFEPKQREDGSACMEAFLRGRVLRGSDVELPAGYRGLLLRPAPGAQDSSDACERSWVAAATFDRFTAWNHDTAPSASDPVRRALEWCALAKQVHAAVTPDEVEEELKRMAEAEAEAAATTS
ncbi:hypothetical protein CHLRE_08g378100v5 [Chlamydomonas reinhardtii]|uniref:Uncharacterized protein n=1 Tax=Chlamydomonas reinhardtii TaxID=3055 RepID=A8IZA6_CHLRE|nr:uncharacterized protein CHLRE_08g378100v5 [Chlamydomonas reinhardtii]PNW80104.1 hypothetical protein CHLRE_08g378100v5 [Chlamydomonas reinhardtii]|eukprot:XP_001694368.1 hypothetical protein CHLREDRAFT_205506 [Chlamydomonas reinhardtii]